MNTISAVIGSTPFKIFFAAWTGYYLVQLLYSGIANQKWEWFAMGAAFLFALFYLAPSTSTSGSTT